MVSLALQLQRQDSTIAEWSVGMSGGCVSVSVCTCVYSMLLAV